MPLQPRSSRDRNDRRPPNRRSHIAYKAAVEAAGWTLNCNVRVVEGKNSNFPTAILCSNDLTATGAVQALLLAGLSVPEDASVIGADDIPMAHLRTRFLTTVHIPWQELGRVAFSVLHRMLNGDAPDELEVLLDCSFAPLRGTLGLRR